MDDIITISTTDQTTTIDLSSIKPVEFNWMEADMSTGIIAQEIGPITTSIINSGLTSGSTISTVTIGSSDNYSHASKSDLAAVIDRLEKIEAMLLEEAEIRANHPAVERAYDEYRLLMTLSKKNPGDLLTED
jgi:hypothetical protein